MTVNSAYLLRYAVHIYIHCTWIHTHLLDMPGMPSLSFSKILHKNNKTVFSIYRILIEDDIFTKRNIFDAWISIKTFRFQSVPSLKM